MHIRLNVGLLVCACYGILAVVHCRAAEPDDVARDAGALEAAHLEWLRDTAFVCRFKTYLASPATRDAALSLSSDRMELEGSGLFVKTGSVLRLTYTPESAPVSVDGQDAWRNIPVDEASNDLIQMRFEIPNAARDITTMSVELREATGALPYQAGTLTRSVLTPLYIAGRRYTQAYSFGETPGDNRTIKLTENDRDRATVEVTEDNGIWWQRKTVEFSLTGSVPVICRVATRNTNQSNENWTESITIGRDFVECTGGPVARQVLFVSSQKGRDSWKARLWVSDDLGAREPKPADFTIDVPDQCLIRGLKNSALAREGRSLNVFHISPEDLTTEPPLAPREISPELVTSRRQAKSLILINGALLVAFGVIWAARRYRAR